MSIWVKAWGKFQVFATQAEFLSVQAKMIDCQALSRKEAGFVASHQTEPGTPRTKEHMENVPSCPSTTTDSKCDVMLSLSHEWKEGSMTTLIETVQRWTWRSKI